ncbi:MAG: serpin family protein [Acidimicrobiales bacterium]
MALDDTYAPVDSVDREAARTAVRDLTVAMIDHFVDGSANVACSGLGLWNVVAVLASGADGATADELASLIGVSADRAAAAVTGLDTDVDAVDGVAHALGMWSQVPTYRAWREELPTIGVAHLGDDTDLAAWVADHTGGAIPGFDLTIPSDALLVLADLIRVKVTWADAFPKDSTRHRAFRAPGGDADVSTMTKTDATDCLAVVGRTLTYDVPTTAGEGPATVMRFAIGAADASPAEVIGDIIAPHQRRRPLSACTWSDLPDDATTDSDLPPGSFGRFTVFLPKFATTTSLDLLSLLDVLGARRCQTDQAGFTRMSPEPLMVEQALQDSEVKLDEAGVEATVVTRSSMVTTGRYKSPDLEVFFDRPFGYALVTEDTGLPLFAGWVADPTVT